MTIKLQDEEIKRFKELEGKWNILTSRLGKLHYQKKAVLAELELTDNALDELDTERFSFISELQKKYGEGVIDPEQMTFTPNEKK